MSTDALFWALKQSNNRASENLVLIHLADRADHEDKSFPSVAYLEERTGLDRKTVISSLDKLEQKGVIYDTGERKGSTLQVKVYCLGITEPFKPETVPFFPDNSTVFPVKSTVFPCKESQKRDTDTISYTIKDTKTYTVVLPDWFPEQLLSDFKAHRKAMKNPMSDRSVQLFIREVSKLKESGYDPVQCIETAILNGWKSVYAPKNLPLPSGQNQWVNK